MRNPRNKPFRAFETVPKDRRTIRLTAENYPIPEFNTTDEMLTSLGVGETALTALSERGAPTPLVALSRMGALA